MIDLQFKKLHPAAILPVKTKGNIGIDLVSIEDVYLKPGERKTIRTGLAIDIPEGYAIILKDRSGNAAKRGLHILAGVIDSSYTGELLVCVSRLDFNPEHKIYYDNLRGNQIEDSVPFFDEIKKGDKICQFIVVPDYQVNITEVEEIVKVTDRGDKGFGSSGR